MTAATACEGCGAELMPQARFCAICGRAVRTAAAARAHYMSVLFCDLKGFTPLTERLGDEAMFELIRRFHALCRSTVADHGGMVAKFMGDGMLAYFGYPTPDRNSPATAVRAAADILAGATLRADGVSASAGVATGWMVIAEDDPAGAASEALAVGSTVNLAARLQSEAAVGQIVVAEETRRRLDSGQFRLLPQGRRRLRGLDAPVEIWTASPTQARSTAKTFIGREDALARLDAVWAEVGTAGLRVCEVRAPGGYGKSALAAHFVANRVSESQRLEIAAERHLQHQGFACFRVLVRAVFGLHAGLSAAEARAILQQRTPAEAADGLIDLMGLSAAPVPAPVRQPRIAAALTVFLAGLVGHTPTILLFEDAHWMDPDTAALLPDLAAALADRPLLVLVTRRPVTGAPLPDATVVELAELDSRDAARLLDRIDPEGRIGVPERRALTRRASGVPLYLEHMACAVLERTSGHAEAVPTTILEALLERLESMGDARSLVEAIAVLGTDVRLDLLARMLDEPPGALRSRISTMIGRGLLQIVADGTVSFDHVLVGEAILGTILSARRRELHARALAAYAAVDPDRLERDPTIAAQHLAGAGRMPEAIPAMLEAAKAQMAAGELRDAADLVRRARDALPEVPDPALRERLEMGVQFLLGVALIQISGFDDPAVGEAYGRAMQLCLDIGGSGEAEFQIAWGIWAHSTLVGDMIVAARMRQRMDEIATECPELAVLAASAHALDHAREGDFARQQAAMAHTRALYAPERDGLRAVTYSMDPLEMALLFEIHCRYVAGDTPAWEAAQAEAWAHAERLGLDFLGPYIAVFGNAPHTYAPGDEAAIARIRAGVAHAAEIGQPFWVIAGQQWLAMDAAWRDGPARSIETLRTEVDRAAQMRQTITLGYFQARLAEACARLGLAEEARMRIAAAESEVARGRCGIHEPEILRLKSEALWHCGAADAAAVRALLDEADALAARRGMQAWRWLVAASRAGVTAHDNSAARAATILAADLDALATPDCERHPAYRHARATLARLCGVPARAVATHESDGDLASTTPGSNLPH